MPTTKPLPRKKRVLNRGYLYSRTKDDVKNPEVTLLDIDSAINHYFNFVINNESYATDILTFTDKNNFFSPLFIGVSYQKFLTETTS